MKYNNFMLALVCLLTIAASSCKKDTSPSALPRTDIHLDTNTLVGVHIVDKEGRSLYYFSNDVNGQSNCSGGCLTAWPIYYADTVTTTFGSELSSTDFKTITTAGGAKQTTYKGWPLYYYAPSGIVEGEGEVKGEGIGNIWFVAKTNYSITVANYQLTGANGVNYMSDYTPGDGLTKYFCDGKGNTLYAFGKDSAYKNKFTKPDFSNNPVWPVYETENITVPSTLDKTLFTVIDVFGKKQLTYKGWPLYYYGPDAGVRGINKGISVPTSAVGKVWPVVNSNSPLAPR
jgi:predicted lipoprotein with Yx(FWY)xxD motif